MEWSNKLISDFAEGKNIAVISDTTLEELEKAPSKVREVLDNIPNKYKEIIILTDEALELAGKYIEENVIPESSLIDSRHIAVATVYRVDMLVSWNFKHIVNFNKIRLYNSVNLKYGYPLIEIRSPREVVHEK